MGLSRILFFIYERRFPSLETFSLPKTTKSDKANINLPYKHSITFLTNTVSTMDFKYIFLLALASIAVAAPAALSMIYIQSIF